MYWVCLDAADDDYDDDANAKTKTLYLDPEAIDRQPSLRGGM